MPTWMQYAMAASQEALEDAGWHPKTEEEQRKTVKAYSLRVCHIIELI